ncbi:MAG: hypothetical protein AAB131_23745, partial [Actinomycetota bacterium]
SGPAGKGMTIENGTGQTLHVHFSGPLTRTVVVPDGRSESVELAVGEYQVAAEVPGSRIIPFYGRQAYQSFTHYWLKFVDFYRDPILWRDVNEGIGLQLVYVIVFLGAAWANFTTKDITS